MNQVPAHLIEEAGERGIVEGATVRRIYSQKDGIVSNPCRWTLERAGGIHDPGLGAWLYDADKWVDVITPAPSVSCSEGLKEGDWVKTTRSMSDALFELCSSLGLPTHDPGSKAHVVWSPNLTFIKRNELTPEEFMRRMRITAAQPKPIKIGEHVVKFDATGITVGCTSVDFATLEAVYNKAKATRA